MIWAMAKRSAVGRGVGGTTRSKSDLEREIRAAVSGEDASIPAWQRGLDMSESRRIADMLRGPEGSADRLIKSKEESARRPKTAVRIQTREGSSAGSTSPRGVLVSVRSPGVGRSNVWRVADTLRAAGTRIDRVEPWGVVMLVRADQDLESVAHLVRSNLLEGGYEFY